MLRFLSFVYLALALLITVQTAPSNSNSSKSDNELPQIKVTHGKVIYINPKYVRAFDINIVKHNATYNDIHTDVDLIDDLPINPYIDTIVYLTDSNYENPVFLLKDTITLCENATDHDILPKAVSFPSEKLHGRCVKKGFYDINDMGLFRFDVLVPNVHDIGDYHLSVYTVYTEKELISNMTLYSEWGYLHTE